MYDPDAPLGQRYTCMAPSPIKRFYHNNALLLPTGDVLVGGSEQGEQPPFAPIDGRPESNRIFAVCISPVMDVECAGCTVN